MGAPRPSSTPGGHLPPGQALGRGPSRTDGLTPCTAHTAFGDHFVGGGTWPPGMREPITMLQAVGRGGGGGGRPPTSTWPVGSLGPPEDWASDPLKRPQARL